jgi:hypothetical protein
MRICWFQRPRVECLGESGETIAANFNATCTDPSPGAEKIHKENNGTQACQLAAISALILGMTRDHVHAKDGTLLCSNDGESRGIEFVLERAGIDGASRPCTERQNERAQIGRKGKFLEQPRRDLEGHGQSGKRQARKAAQKAKLRARPTPGVGPEVLGC